MFWSNKKVKFINFKKKRSITSAKSQELEVDNSNIFYMEIVKILVSQEIETTQKRKLLIHLHNLIGRRSFSYRFIERKTWFIGYDEFFFFLTSNKKRRLSSHFTAKNSNLWEDDLKSGRKKRSISFRSPNLANRFLWIAPRKKSRDWKGNTTPW